MLMLRNVYGPVQYFYFYRGVHKKNTQTHRHIHTHCSGVSQWWDSVKERWMERNNIMTVLFRTRVRDINVLSVADADATADG